jgi:hypothetical protein
MSWKWNEQLKEMETTTEYVCRECGETKTKAELSPHIDTHFTGPDIKKPFKCDICSVSFQNRALFNFHFCITHCVVSYGT